MTCYIISFETNSSDVKNKLIEKLKAYKSYCPINDNCWAIRTDNKAVQIRDFLSTVLNPQDRLFIIRSGSEAAWKNSYGEAYNKWLKENL